MKIAHVTQYFHPQMGYQENNLAVIERKNGHEVAIFCINNLDKWNVKKQDIQNLDMQFYSSYNIPVFRLNYFFHFSTRFFQTGLNKALKKFNPDMVFIHGIALPLPLVAMKWATKNKKLTIVDDHMVQAGSKNKYSDIFYKIFRPALKFYLKSNKIKINKWIAVSGETKEFMKKNYGITDNIEVVPLGYNSDLVFYDEEGSKNWMLNNGLSRGNKYVLYIGKLDFHKNPLFILEPFKIFKKEFPDYKLLFVGNISKEYYPILTSKIVELELVESVVLLNQVSNKEIRLVFSSADIVIWPFGSSMAMLEAMASKCPVIASDMPVNRERLSAGRGILFESNNMEDLVKKMRFAVLNREVITKKAIDWVEQYDWNNLEKKMMEGLNSRLV